MKLQDIQKEFGANNRAHLQHLLNEATRKIWQLDSEDTKKAKKGLAKLKELCEKIAIISQALELEDGEDN